jgi:DNA-binding Lrp family transcriptional regulator
MSKLLSLLQKNARLSSQELGAILGKKTQEVEREIAKLIKDKTILGFKTIVNPKIIECDKVRALIEVKVVPTRGSGFDEVAKRIARFSEVKTVQLISGSFDLLVIVEGKSLHEAAAFVSEKLSTIDKVQGTKTHFLLKKYKEDGILFFDGAEDTRLPIVA